MGSSFLGVTAPTCVSVRNWDDSLDLLPCNKLCAQSFHRGKREDLTTFGTLKIDIFKVLWCGDLERKQYCTLHIWTRLEEHEIRLYCASLISSK